MNIALLRQKEPDRVETVEIDDSEDLSDEQAQRDEEDEAANDIAEANQELMSGHGQDEEESN